MPNPNTTSYSDFQPIQRPRRIKNLTGQRFGRLLVVAILGTFNRTTYWLCLCKCGQFSNVGSSALTHATTMSCGCYGREQRLASLTTHGQSRSDTWWAWSGILTRCFNPRSAAYKNYGGRGITVSAEWMDFGNFLRDVGEKPSADYSIDRIDNNGNYEKGNVRWATNITQARNTRSNHLLTFNGVTQAASAWAEQMNLPYKTLMARLYAGWDTANALTKPLRKRN